MICVLINTVHLPQCGFTGTLTTNEMCVVKLAMPVGSSMKSWDVEGHNYTPVGRVSGLSIHRTQSLAQQFLAKIGCMCALTINW